MNEWLHDSPLKSIAFKAIMIMPSILLQKPSKNSKAKDHSIALHRRMELWNSGNMIELLHEAETIQNYLPSTVKKHSIAEISKRFLKEMQKGNVNGALKILTNNMKNGVLPLNDETLSLIKQKHPDATAADPTILLPDEPVNVHPIRFDMIDAEMIRKVAVKTKGGAGPSGLDGDGWC